MLANWVGRSQCSHRNVGPKAGESELDETGLEEVEAAEASGDGDMVWKTDTFLDPLLTRAERDQPLQRT
jgi:hypothetical protein